jgi:hypothetical protein
VATAVFAGSATAPLVALLVVLAPLLALLAAGRSADAAGASVVTRVAGLLAAGMVQVANVMLMSGVAALSGIPFRQSLIVIGVWACSILVWRRAPAVWSCALVLGMAGLAVTLVAMGAGLPGPPWTAWAQLASRPTLAFSPGAAWVTEGRTVQRSTTLTFNDTHQVTALSGGVFRVEAQERRLSPGDVLALRPGDRLTIPPDVRVRFEAGKRIPGGPMSGVVWAEPPRRPSWPALVEALGLAVTLAGGAVTLLGGGSHASRLTAAIAAPALLIAFVLMASSWGVYAVWFAGDLGLGASSLAPLVEAGRLSLGDGGPTPLLLLGALGLTLLFLASTAGLANRMRTLAEVWGAREAGPAVRLLPDVLWLGMLVIGVALSQYALESGTLLRLGWGLGASAWAGPRLAGARGAVGAGTLTGGAIFAALSIADALALPEAAFLGHYPALLAAPAAAVVATVGRRRRASSHALHVRPATASVAGNGRP